MSASKQIENCLNLFPEVKWDRWAGNFEKCAAFGWIERPDGRSDFMSIVFKQGQWNLFTTSSEKYSSEFSKRLGVEDHISCKRIEEFFNVLNCVRLAQ